MKLVESSAIGSSRPLPSNNRAEPWLIRLSRRWPAPYWLGATLPAVLILLLGARFYQQEIAAEAPAMPVVVNRLVMASLIIPYILMMMRFLHDATARTLVELRSAVMTPDDEYTRLSHTLLTVNQRVDRLLPVVGFLGGVVTLVYQYRINPGFRNGIEQAPLTHLVIITGEMLMALLVVLFVYSGFERGFALYRLLQLPLRINAFDPSALEPLNRLSARVTLALIGLVSLPLLVWRGYRPGEPMPILVFVAASLSAIVAFLLPLWGAHLQMAAARNRELQANRAKLNALYRELHDRVDRAVDGRDIADEVNALVQFQHLLDSAPTWPYEGIRIGLGLLAPIALPLVIYILQALVTPLLAQTAK